jgi:hypothetical protein
LPVYLHLNLRVEAEESIHALPKLSLDLVFAPFENVHCNPGRPAILQFHFCFADRFYFLRRQQTHSVNKDQVCHLLILSKFYMLVFEALNSTVVYNLRR